MFRRTNRVRLRIDLTLSDADSFASAAPARRPLLVPAAPAIGTARLRSSLLTPASGVPVRGGSSDPSYS